MDRNFLVVGRCLRVCGWWCVGAFVCLCGGAVVCVCLCCPLGCVCGVWWLVVLGADGFGSGGFRLGEKRGVKKKQEVGKKQPESKR